MTISQIECFVEAAKTGSFSKTGVNLFISQQVVSRQIKALELECGFPLFERKSHGVELTQQGQILFPVWESLLVEHRTALDKAKDFYFGECNTIRIGVVDFLGQNKEVLTAILRYIEKNLDLNVEYEALPMWRLYDGLETGKLHMMVTFASELELADDLHCLPLGERQFRTGIIVAKGHPLAKENQISLQDLENYSFGYLSQKVSLDYKRRVLHCFETHQMTGKIKLKEYQSRQSLLMALLTGKCATIMYDNFLEGMEEKLYFYPLEEEKASARFVIAWKHEKYGAKARNIAFEFQQV